MAIQALQRLHEWSPQKVYWTYVWSRAHQLMRLTRRRTPIGASIMKSSLASKEPSDTHLVGEAPQPASKLAVSEKKLTSTSTYLGRRVP